MVKVIPSASAVVVALLFAGSATAIAQEKLRIVDFYVDEIDVYKDATGETKVKQVERSKIKTPIDVLEVSPNYMMRVNAGELEGWIYATIVETEGGQFEDSEVGPCNHALPEEYTALRNVGNQCGE